MRFHIEKIIKFTWWFYQLLIEKIHKNFVKSELLRTHVQFIGTIQKKEWREGSDFCPNLSCWTSTSPRTSTWNQVNLAEDFLASHLLLCGDACNSNHGKPAIEDFLILD